MKKTSIIFSLGAAACALAAELSPLHERLSNWTIGQTVQTDSGPVTGHAAKNASQVSEYLGIPFAKPPTGNLRFAAPVRYSGNSTINGTSFGLTCPQVVTTTSLAAAEAAGVTEAGLLLNGILGEVGPYGEDCLTLNIWTKPQGGNATKAVLLWIYGGGFNSGSSSIPGYNGQNIADQEDIVVVSLNYRITIFGFPGNPTTTNNLGLLDQRMAVEWVRDNIAALGGDPARITLFGQSAGGASVDYYTYAWASDPIAAGFIPESGTVLSFGQSTVNQSAAAWYNVTATLGCGDASSDAASVLSCMRTKNYTQILNAIPAQSGLNSIIGDFGPTIDETVIFSDYPARSAAGNVAKKPLLIGNTDYEAGLFSLDLALENITYPDAFWLDFDLEIFTCPVGERANYSVALSLPTWRYRWFGNFPNTNIRPGSGAWHASELPILFDAAPEEIPSTAAEVSIGKYLRGAWATFAKDPVNGLTTYGGGWPRYNAGESTLIRLAYNNLTGTNLALPYTYDFPCAGFVLYNSSTPVNPYTYTSAPTVAPTASGGSATATTSGNSSVTGSAPATQSTSAGSGLSIPVFMVVGAIVAGSVF
jgi:carboxylesterase type B